MQPSNQLGSCCPKVMSFLVLHHFVSVLCSFRGKKRPRLALLLFLNDSDFRMKPINSLISSQRKINSAARVPAGLEQVLKKGPSCPGARRASTKWKYSLINFIYPLDPPQAFLQIITPDVLNKLGQRAASGTDCSVPGGRLLASACDQ